MDPNNRRLHESVAIIKLLSEKSLTELNATAVSLGVSIRSFDESFRQFIERLYKRMAGKSDFDLACSTYSLMQTLLDRPVHPATVMKERIKRTVKTNLDDIKAEDVRTDEDFMHRLKCL